MRVPARFEYETAGTVDAFEDLSALHGDKAVWKLVSWAYIDADLPRDVDTPEDWEEVRRASTAPMSGG